MSPSPSPPPMSAPARRRRSSRAFARVLLAPLALALVASGPAAAQQGGDEGPPEDWPCIQRLVPEITPAVLWPVPIEPDLTDTWRADPELQALAHYLGELETLDEAAIEAIDAYAASVPESLRRRALSRLADGILAVANARRARQIDGIRRYTRQQIAIASQIEQTLNALATLDDAEAGAEAADAEAADVAAGASRAEIEETLAWHERLYDQRERAIRALCERPVALEETLSAVLRELSYRLPDA